MYPEIKFTLLDSIAKKIKVVSEIATALKLENVEVAHSRAEEHKGDYDLIIGRAVSTLSQMVEWSEHLVSSERWIILKGVNQKKSERKSVLPTSQNSFL
jgi:16S rRNA (guanine527-N7)-methyltransferase